MIQHTEERKGYSQNGYRCNMEYWEEINTKLKPWVDADLDKTVIDLLAGCGGLSLGFEANGFKTIVMRWSNMLQKPITRILLVNVSMKN